MGFGGGKKNESGVEGWRGIKGQENGNHYLPQEGVFFRLKQS